jgi:hypothetical protein
VNGTGGAASESPTDEADVPEWPAGIAEESICGFLPDKSSATSPIESEIRFEPVAADADEGTDAVGREATLLEAGAA